MHEFVVAISGVDEVLIGHIDPGSGPTSSSSGDSRLPTQSCSHDTQK